MIQSMAGAHVIPNDEQITDNTSVEQIVVPTGKSPGSASVGPRVAINITMFTPLVANNSGLRQVVGFNLSPEAALQLYRQLEQVLRVKQIERSLKELDETLAANA